MTDPTKLDWSKIQHYIEANKTKKPPMVAVSDKEWSDALDGYAESIPEGFDETTTTEIAWPLIYLSALAFCRGMERAEVKHGLREESYYPRY